jgi:glycosidase
MNTLWPKRPVIYEINTWVWLNELSQYYGRTIKLGDVPTEQLQSIAALHVDAVWLMGVWERSPDGIRIANENASLQDAFQKLLPNYTPADNVGSAYCVHRYVVDENLGGPQGLAEIRELLAKLDIRLMLDFVPNHVAPDHPWIREHPEYFVQGTREDLLRRPDAFFEANGTVIARGRDPNYPPWPDVAQLNAFHPGLRQDIVQTLNSIADQCDAIRCDMAMLLLNSIFESTWGVRAGLRPQEEYWHEVISHVRTKHPALLFMAEAYWNKEWELQQIGFDYCYDKTLYERLVNDHAESIRLHLTAGLDYQDKLLRFIENHDEPRASAAFSLRKGRAAAVAVMTLPGAKLLYEGQLEGRKVRSSVFLARRQVEPVDFGLQAFYHKLLTAVSESGHCSGEWQLCERTGWPDNNRHQNLVAWCWRQGETGYLIVINLSDVQSQGRIKLPWGGLDGNKWQLTDRLSGDIFLRSGDEMHSSGLYVDLPPWGFHFLQAKVYFPQTKRASRLMTFTK